MVLKVVSGGPLNGPVYYQGTWNANTNTPNLQSGLGFTGEYYIVSVAGNTTLDGNTNWQVGDWAVFNGATNLWEKIDGSGSYGTTLSIVNDTSSSTTYNLVMTTATGGLIDKEYVDNIGLVFKPSGTGYADSAFKTKSGKFTGTIVLTPSWTDDTQAFVLGEAYTTNGGTITMYTPGDAGNFALEPNAWNKYGWLGLGISGTYNVPYPLTVTNLYGSPTTQIFVTENPDQTTAGLKIGHASSNSSVISSGVLTLGSTSISRLTVDNNGNVNQTIPLSNIHGSIQEVYYRFVNQSGTSLVNLNAYDGSIIGGPTGSGYLEININNGSDDQANYLSIGYNGQFGFNQNWGTSGQVFKSNGTAGPPTWVNVSSLAVIQINTGTGLTGGPITSSGTISIANTTVTAASYGNASTVATFTVNAQGQLTAAGNTTIAIANTQVSGLGTMSTQNSNNVTITGGSISNVTLSNVSINTSIVTKTANYTASTTDETILVNAAGLVTITLPTAVGVAGKIYTVKKIDNTAYATTIATTSSQTIDGLTTYTLSNQYGGVNVQSDGSNWYIIANIFGRNGTTGTF